MNVGLRFKEIRENMGISVYKLSKDSDISENHIHNVEKGRSQPSVELLEKLLHSLGLTMSEFFRDDNETVYPTEYEAKLLSAVRGLPKEKAEAVLNIASLFHK